MHVCCERTLKPYRTEKKVEERRICVSAMQDGGPTANLLSITTVVKLQKQRMGLDHNESDHEFDRTFVIQSPRSLEAMNRLGIKNSELQMKPLAFFTPHHNEFTAQDPAVITNLRLEAYEKERKG